jgi:hypothetical protein
VDEVAVEQGVDSVNQRMRSTSLEPDMTAKMAFAGSDCHKPATRLEDDPGLLGIYMNRPDCAHREHQRLKDSADLWTLAFEVFINCVLATGM